MNSSTSTEPAVVAKAPSTARVRWSAVAGTTSTPNDDPPASGLTATDRSPPPGVGRRTGISATNSATAPPGSAAHESRSTLRCAGTGNPAPASVS